MRSMRELGERLEDVLSELHLFPSRFMGSAPPSQGHPSLPSPGWGQRRKTRGLKRRGNEPQEEG